MKRLDVVTLRRAYRESGMTLGQIASRAGVSENTAWSIMAGRNVRTVSLFRVCRVLNVPALPVPPEDAPTDPTR